MNRSTKKLLSGTLVAGLSLALAASAEAQQAARSGAWTLNAPEGEWHMTGRDYSLQRFSPLKQITTANVTDLRPVWSFSTGTLRGHEGNPLVIGNIRRAACSGSPCAIGSRCRPTASSGTCSITSIRLPPSEACSQTPTLARRFSALCS